MHCVRAMRPKIIGAPDQRKRECVLFFLAPSSKVQLGEQYEMVYTSWTGLYRYRTGDVVKVVDFFHQSPVYEFQYRSLHWDF